MHVDELTSKIELFSWQSILTRWKHQEGKWLLLLLLRLLDHSFHRCCSTHWYVEHSMKLLVC